MSTGLDRRRAVITQSALFLLTACTAPPGAVRVRSLVADEAAIVSDFLTTIGDDRLVSSGPLVPAPTGFAIDLDADEALCTECFQIDVDGRRLTVRGGGRLGRLYGLSAALEGLGWRFPHPHDATLPEAPALADDLEADASAAPDVARRGLHLHTLHPIEAELDLWEGGDGAVARADAILDWIIRQRGNHVQWVALDDIQESGARQAAWAAHTREITDHAHARGLTVGLGIQLFGSGNLQRAWDLLDRPDDTPNLQAELDERLAGIADAGFDTISLSFGEFFAESPETFLSSATLTWDRVQAAIPDAHVTATLHVGDELRVDYAGQDLPYYFLATYVDRPIVPHVHTVMFYNLYEDAGGAYNHDDFAEHRALLEQRLRDGQPVGYHPESAYWIAFDDSVPNFMPIYLQTRWTDTDRIRSFVETTPGATPLDELVLFSSGWEWGYAWTDAAVLRDAWRHLETPWSSLEHALAPHGEPGAALAALTAELGALQHADLLERRLAPWIASYDNIMELGFAVGTIAQPRRPLPKELVLLDEPGRVALRESVLKPLDAHASAAQALRTRAEAVAADHRSLAELVDGISLYAVRAAFAATLAHALVDADPDRLADAEPLLAAARGIVDRRHADLHDPGGRRLLDPVPNATIYDFGYLYRADTLCFWRRELAQARAALGLDADPAPGCGVDIER